MTTATPIRESLVAGCASVLTALLAACLFGGGVVVPDADAAPGYLAQKGGPAGCIWRLVAAPCAHGRALDGPGPVAVSPDGASVYVASSTALAIFDRALDGTLAQRPGTAGCMSGGLLGEPLVDGCARGRALDEVAAVAVSRDSRSVYVASSASNAIAVLDRAPDGALTQKPGTAGCISNTGAGPCADGRALRGPRSVTVSTDDRSVYVASANSVAIAVFDRGPGGALTQKPGTAGCISHTGAGPCAHATAIDEPASVTISPDGGSVYAASAGVDGVVTVFDRAPDGTLTQKPGAAGCISDTGAGMCSNGTALSAASSVTVSPDGTSAYVASDVSGAVAVFDRATDGMLTQKPGRAGCISYVKAGPCAQGTALRGATAVTVSPDGDNVYVTSNDAVAVFDRAPDGTLTQKPGTQGCSSDSGAGPCVRGSALAGADSVTVSPDGNNAYVASATSRGLAIFDRLPTMPAAPPPDTAKPLLTGLDVTPSNFHAARGAELSYDLSEPTAVSFTVARVLPGNRIGGRCLKPRRSARRRTSCRRYASLRGTFTDRGLTGSNYVPFKGRLLGRPLAPGRYRAIAIATDAAGNASAPKRVDFTIRRG